MSSAATKRERRDAPDGDHGGDNANADGGDGHGDGRPLYGAATVPSRSSVPSHDVARGSGSLTAIRGRRRRLENDRMSKMDPRERERMESYLHGGEERAHSTRKRRAELREEDDEEDAAAAARPAAAAAAPRSKDERRRGRRGDKALRAKMEAHDHRRAEAAVAAADAELVLHTQESGLIETETDMERTYKLTQAELRRDHLDEQTARQIFDLKLDRYGPYGYNYDRSGRRGLLFGNRGHVALMDCHSLALKTEFYVNETVRDGVFLHNSTMFALAQKRNVYIYDDAGAEIHRLDDHEDVHRMQFLPYHWLLATVGRHGWLKYHDTSTGNLVSRHRTKLGPCSVMRQNPSNAVVHLGHSNGTVTLWSPASSEYLVKMQCHRGAPVTCLAVDQSGRYMATGGADSTVRIFDLRTYRETHSYYTAGAGPPTSLDISQKGMLGIGHGCRATFWSPAALKTKVADPYMGHTMAGCGPVDTLRFRPFEDVCGVGHTGGVSSIVIPGSGEANLDSAEYNADPYQDGKQRREAEVRALMDKLSPDMIALDPDVVGTVEGADPRRRLERTRDLQEEANRREGEEADKPKPKEKKKMRGRSKIQKKLKRKRKNVVDANVVKLRELREKEREEKAQAKRGEAQGGDGVGGGSKEEAPQALKRFFQ